MNTEIEDQDPGYRVLIPQFMTGRLKVKSFVLQLGELLSLFPYITLTSFQNRVIFCPFEKYRFFEVAENSHTSYIYNDYKSPELPAYFIILLLSSFHINVNPVYVSIFMYSIIFWFTILT
ncbi:Hypothetical_protein [Hexamita inflata]|uniref:Hypothetical_protein n=1 Tax=Hexamita inflata TaxID=28002 RepID=A0AA86TNF9_9EUKA|nr:Hypothetical protein HINF_LOCUS10335 [Hexamita inflata]